tara:strand:+ start:57 stop:542 length:486 start_codon:yes stop_codon:yes gene_type:complete
MSSTFYSARASGLGHAAAYQVAGKPYLTGSIVQTGNGTGAGQQFKVTFPTVTNNIKLVVTGTAALKIHFDDLTAAPALVNENNYFLVAPGMNHYGSGTADNYISGSFNGNFFEMNVKCKEIYMSSTGTGQSGFQLFAELTSIPSGEMYTLSGSGINSNGSQ